MSVRSLGIVVVNHNGGDALPACIDSLYRDPEARWRENARIVIVDSGSSDSSLARTLARYRGITGIVSRANIGFAKGCNQGAAEFACDNLLFLNPDTRVAPGAIDRLLRHLASHPEVAACGPRILTGKGSLQPTGQSFPTPWNELSRQWERCARWLGRFVPNTPPATQTGPVDWISGACLLVRGTVWQQLGGFDDRYFLYFEETDWCRRARLSGYEVHHVVDAVIHHQGGACAINSGQRLRGGVVAAHYARSRRRYFRRWHGLLSSLFVDGIHATRALAERIGLVKVSNS